MGEKSAVRRPLHPLWSCEGHLSHVAVRQAPMGARQPTLCLFVQLPTEMHAYAALLLPLLQSCCQYSSNPSRTIEANYVVFGGFGGNLPRSSKLIRDGCVQFPAKDNTIEQVRGGFLRAMSDAGLKPTVVYHNLTPAELYEKARLVALTTAMSVFKLVVDLITLQPTLLPTDLA